MKRKFLTFCSLSLLSINLMGGMIEHTYTSPEVPINFVTSISVPKFDSSLGELNKIEFQLTGRFTGASRTENLSPTPVTITLNNNIRFRQSISGGVNLFDEYVNKQDVFNAMAWDGSFPPDWDGQSGENFEYSNYIFETFSTEKNDYASLELFTGIGTVDFDLSAYDYSTTGTSGSNIVASQFENVKSMISTITYHYTSVSPVPEPHVYGLIGGVVCMVAILYRRRFK